jgi:uncharacterized protein with LGFP repeats
MINKIALGLLAFVVFGSTIALAQNSALPMQRACSFQLGETIFAKWKTFQASGILGCPVNSEGEATYSPQGTSGGRWAQFRPGTQGATDGYIIFADSGPHAGVAYVVHGCMYNIYNLLGSTGGVFGFPVSDENPVQGGTRQDFEGGNIQYDSATGNCAPHLNQSAQTTQP